MIIIVQNEWGWRYWFITRRVGCLRLCYNIGNCMNSPNVVGTSSLTSKSLGTTMLTQWTVKYEEAAGMHGLITRTLPFEKKGVLRSEN